MINKKIVNDKYIEINRFNPVFCQVRRHFDKYCDFLNYNEKSDPISRFLVF